MFRPPNVYGPDMGWKHVIPQFISRALDLKRSGAADQAFTIQGSGQETRAFAYVTDVVESIIRMYEAGGHRQIYHIGNDEEITVGRLAELILAELDCRVPLAHDEAAAGGTTRRCPDIAKMRAIGYAPLLNMSEGIKSTVAWYAANFARARENTLV